ncbi:MAG TPA: hypothetical protein VGK73_08625 [Polyangiaceae bacterium]
MSVISRGSLPANYEDFLGSVSSALLLPQPEPQYLFAHWAMAGRLSLAALNAGAPSVQQYVTMAGGGAAIPQDLDRMARAADAYPGFVQAVDKFGLGLGDTVKFQRPVFSTGGLTKAARKLSTNQTINTTGQAIKTEEVPVVLEEYHGPYASNGSAPEPYAIWGFDAKYRANKVQLASLASLNLKRDYTKWLDAVIRDEFLASSNVSYAGGLANAAAFVSGGGQYFDLALILAARKALSDREWMKFPNGRYVCLVPTSFNVQMQQDVDYREMSKFHEDKSLLYGYIGSVQDIDFFECSTLKSYAATESLEGSTVASGVTLDEAMLVGPGAVGFGTVAPDPENVVGPVARFADNTNFGTVLKVIWYALHAFSCLDDRGVQRIVAQR